jgi:cytoskeletal protein RodZ
MLTSLFFGGIELDNDFQTGSRSGNRAKRKKTNLVLNSLIAIVLLLIIFVAYAIFSGGKDKAATKNADKSAESKQTLQHNKSNGKKASKDEKAETDQNQGKDEDTSSDEPDDNAGGQSGESDAQAVVTEGGSTSNVKQTIENPEWKPVGTTQSGEHAAVYDQSSADWQEMLNAVSYATGIDQSNMTVWRLGSNNHDPNRSIATISSKDTKEAYRVYIDWVDGEGWKPSKVEELSENDRGNMGH